MTTNGHDHRSDRLAELASRRTRERRNLLRAAIVGALVVAGVTIATWSAAGGVPDQIWIRLRVAERDASGSERLDLSVVRLGAEPVSRASQLGPGAATCHLMTTRVHRRADGVAADDRVDEALVEVDWDRSDLFEWRRRAAGAGVPKNWFSVGAALYRASETDGSRTPQTERWLRFDRVP